MGVPITTIQGSDNVGLSRLTINTNFGALKAASDAVTTLLDPVTFTLTGLKYISVSNGTLATSAVVLNVANSAAIAGIVTMGTIGGGTASSGVIVQGLAGVSISESNLTLGLGNLILSSATSLANFNGHLSLGRELRLPGIAAALASPIGLTSASPTSIPVSSLKYIVLTNGATTSASAQTHGLTASLLDGTSGQVIEIYHILGPSAGPTRIATDGSPSFYGLTGGIILNATGDRLKCTYDGASWYLWDYTTSAPGGTSISFTRL